MSFRKRLFPVLAGLLWLAFLTLDLTGWGDSTWVKFAAICLCCATAFTGMKTTDGKLVALALCLTVGRIGFCWCGRELPKRTRCWASGCLSGYS